MKRVDPQIKKTTHFLLANVLIYRFLLFAIMMASFVNTKGQATCIAVIDSTRSEFCFGSGSITFSDAIAIGQNVEWLTSGDGTFNDRFAQNTTYTPGPADLANGYVFIYLDVYKDDPVDYCSSLPVATLNLGNMRAVATPSSQTVCSGVALTPVVLTAGPSTTVFSWTRDNTATVTGMAASGTGTIRGGLTNTTAVPVTVTFTATPTNGSCSGTPITTTVLVNPRIVVTASTTTQTICSGSAITPVALSSSANGTTYSWTRNNTGSVTGIAASGTGNITGTLSNTTSSPVTVTFTITPTANGCTGTAITSTVIVNPATNVVTTTPALQTICSGANITTIASSGGGGGTTYNWTRNNTASVTGIANSGSGNITGSLTNTTAAPLYVTFTITPSSNSCTNRASVLVNPRPVVVATPSSQSVCSGTAITTIALSSTTGGTTYTWTRNNTGSVTGIPSSGTGSVAGSLTNTSASPVTVTFTITPSANGCTGTPVTATVTVNPAPNAAVAAPSSQTVCSGTGISAILLSGSGNGDTYNWTRDNTVPVTGIAASGTGNITGTLINTASSPVTVTFTITPTANGCSSMPATATVLVNPSGGIATATPSSQNICSGTAITSIVPGGISGAIYNWTRDNAGAVTGIGTSGTGNINGTLTNTTAAPVTVTFTITPTGSGCQAQPVNAAVVVNPLPASVISGSQNICTGVTPSNISIALTGTAPWTFTYTDGTTPVTITGNSTNPYTFTVPALPKTYTVTALNDANCTALPAGITGSAVLSQLSYNITASAGANGSISPNGITSIDCGNNLTYIISANAGYNIQNVLVDGISVGPVSTYTFNNVTATHTISATFNAAAFTITASAGANGTITPSGSVAVANGGNQAFSITANSCYQIINVLVDGVSVGAVSTYTFSNVTAPHTISATFSPATHPIIASAGSNGSISPNGTTNVNCNASQAYTITPSAGFNILNVLVDGVSVGAVSTYTFNNVTAPHSISATFGVVSYTISAGAGANGTITPSGSLSVAGGTSQTFTIAPNSCYQIADVLVDGVSVGAVSTYTFNTVTAPHSISASFLQLSYSITATAGANGSITPTGATVVNCGGSQTYTIAANAGFNISDVVVDGISQGAISTYTFNNVTIPHTISATFNAAAFTIAASAGANGVITPSGSVSVAGSGTQTFNITADNCYQIADVLVDGVSVGIVSAYTFNNVTATHTISASFSQVGYKIDAIQGANGTITPPNGSGVICGGSQAYIITPDAGFNILDVLVDGVSQGPLSTYTFSNVTANHTISATFGVAAFTITAGAGADGTITPSGAVAVASGGNQTFTITPNSCYQIADVLVDGVSVGAVSTYTFSNVTAPHSISASFSQLSYVITAGAGINGIITPAGATSVNCGNSQAYTITATAGFNISDVLVDGVSVGIVSTYTFNNVTGPHTISAAFGAAAFTITATAGAEGTITPSGAVGVASGGSQTFNIAASSCYQIANVLADGVSVGAVSTYTFDNVTAPHTISAAFAPLSYTIIASAGANGTISPTGSVAVNCGGSQTYAITANTGFNISDVQVDGISVGAVSAYTFSNVTATHTISATFSAASFTITASAGANGTITPPGSVTVAGGGSQTFNIAANSCYQIADVLVDSVSVGAVSTYTFSNITATHTISATFSQLNYTITASAGANGSISPNGATGIACGTNQTYTITPAAGFTIQNVLVDGVSAGVVPTYTFSNVTAPHTISATFTAFTVCAAPTISGSVSNVLCRNGNTGAINVTTSGGTAPFTYAWTGPNGFTANTEDVSGLLVGAYRIIITANGGCTSTALYTISQPVSSLTMATSWSPVLCNGGTTTVIVSAAGGTTPYTGAGSITNQLAGERTYTVTDANGCTTSRTVTILQPSAIIASAAAGPVQCGTGTATLTATATGGTGTKQYSLNGGAFQAGNTFTVTVAGSPYVVTVRDANQCTVNTNSITVVQPTSSSAPAQPASLNGPVYGLCGGGVFTYSVPPVSGATGYNWVAPAGCTISSGQGTSQIQLSVPSTFVGPNSIGVTATNSCGAGPQLKVFLFGLLYYPGTSITGPSVVGSRQTNVQFGMPNAANTTYNWLVPSGAVITSGQGTSTITVNFGTSGGNVGVDITNACGTAPRAQKTVTIGLARPVSGNQTTTAASKTVSATATVPAQTYLYVYPNPAESRATVTFNSLKAGNKFELVISNATGKTFFTKSGMSIAGENILQLDLGKLHNGMYVIRLITDENVLTRKLFKGK